MITLTRRPRCAALALAPAAIAAPIGVAAQTVPSTAPQAVPYAALTWVDISKGPYLLRRVQPDGDWRQWIVAEDFPGAAFAGPQINLRLRVHIGADGAVTDCKASEQSTPRAYLPRACQLLRQRGKFRHALSPEGVPVAASIALTLQLSRSVPPRHSPAGERAPLPRTPVPGGVWRDAKRLPGELRRLDLALGLPPSRPVIELSVSAEGIATRCAMRVSTGTDAGDVALCGGLRKARFEPARGQHGDSMPQDDLVLYLRFGQ